MNKTVWNINSTIIHNVIITWSFCWASMPNLQALSTFKKEGLKIHGESSTKALERIVKKAGKYLKNIH